MIVDAVGTLKTLKLKMTKIRVQTQRKSGLIVTSYIIIGKLSKSAHPQARYLGIESNMSL